MWDGYTPRPGRNYGSVREGLSAPETSRNGIRLCSDGVILHPSSHPAVERFQRGTRIGWGVLVGERDSTWRVRPLVTP